MVDPGARRRHLSAVLTSAYGDGLLSDRTLAHRMELLLGSGLIEPERLIGDLPIRGMGDRRLDRLRRAVEMRLGELRARWSATRAPLPLLALDWSGQTEELTLGRDPGCDIVLSHLTVSRSHAALHFRDGVWVLQDLGSRNGTAVNRQPIARCQLRPGDRVQVGAQTLIVD